MNEQINNGGPAFPRHGYPQYSGMTLRDYFAAKAMQGYLTHEAGANAECCTLAGWAYEMADAMLAARSRAAASQVMKNTMPSWGGDPAADAGGWIEWGGGECPVPGDTAVDILLRKGTTFRTSNAIGPDWAHDDSESDIVAYRIHRAGGAA